MKRKDWLRVLAACATALVLAVPVSAMADTDIEDSYCNPLDLEYMHGSGGDSRGELEEAPPEITAAGPNNYLEKEQWTEAEGRMMTIFGKGETIGVPGGTRGAGDPFVYQISDGTIVMHVSGMCWTTKDYIHWEAHEQNVSLGAPTFMELNGKYYLCGNSNDVFVSDCPWGPWESIGKFKMPDGKETGFGDVNFFQDDDGRLYLSYSIGSPIMACELDPNDPTVMLTEPVEIWRNDGRNWWERFGTGLNNSVAAYTEGSQIFKYNGVYYLQVASGGTENRAYNISVKKSTEGPLSGWTYQKHNPVAFNTSNFIPASGHGCFLVDKDNNLVCFYTQVSGMGNRRIGMDVCWVDENGDIHVNITDTPQLAPNLVKDPANGGGDLKLNMLCTVGGRYWVSSYADEHPPVYALDNNCMTWWAPEADDEEPMFFAPLMGIYDVYAVQLNWRELGEFSNDSAVRFVLEYFDLEKDDWVVVADASENEVPHASDYITIPGGARTVAVRLKMIGTTEGNNIGITGFRIFGENYTLAAEHGRWDGYDPMPEEQN